MSLVQVKAGLQIAALVIYNSFDMHIPREDSCLNSSEFGELTQCNTTELAMTNLRPYRSENTRFFGAGRNYTTLAIVLCRVAFGAKPVLHRNHASRQSQAPLLQCYLSDNESHSSSCLYVCGFPSALLGLDLPTRPTCYAQTRVFDLWEKGRKKACTKFLVISNVLITVSTATLKPLSPYLVRSADKTLQK